MTTTVTHSGGARLNGWLPIFPTIGNVFFAQSVSANARNDPGNGTRPETPFVSIDYAVGQCTANRGDIIVAGPGHVETVTAAAGLAFDVAGITVIGLGSGSSRPTVNIGTATSATVTISAANVTLRNLMFVTTLDAVVTAVAISAADVKLYDIETRDTSATQCVDFISTTAAADRLHISDWTHRGDAAAGADTAITIVGGDGLVIENFDLYGNFAVAAIENVTTALTNGRVGGGSKQNYIWTKNAADVAVTMVAASTVSIGPNINAMLTDNAANITEAFVSAGGRFYQPINIVNLAGESSMQTNITASTDA
jgi:hypothetical protein